MDLEGAGGRSPFRGRDAPRARLQSRIAKSGETSQAATLRHHGERESSPQAGRIRPRRVSQQAVNKSPQATATRTSKASREKLRRGKRSVTPRGYCCSDRPFSPQAGAGTRAISSRDVSAALAFGSTIRIASPVVTGALNNGAAQTLGLSAPANTIRFTFEEFSKLMFHTRLLRASPAALYGPL